MIRHLNPHIRTVLHLQRERLTRLDPALVRRRLRTTHLSLRFSAYIAELNRETYPDVADRCNHLHDGVDSAPSCPGQVTTRSPPGPGPRLLFVIPEARTPRELIVHLIDDDLVRALTQVYPGNSIEYLQHHHGANALSRVRCRGKVAQSQLAALYREN